MRFDNSFVRDLPELVERWKADDHPVPTTVAVNEDHARRLGVDVAWLEGPEGASFLTGDVVVEGSEPVAQAYTGHQFGNLAPRLGDGRALLLGEVIDDDGRRHDVHLKGSGRTPFARGGDGKAVLGPMLREFLMCEAMHALGVPTTRALGVATTGEQVMRDGLQPGAVFARTAASHVRIGTFQYAAMLDDVDLLRRLLDHAARRHHPGVLDADDRALAFLDAVMGAQASLVAHWMSLGFVHGVLNTDNVLVSGETIDYGPCAFMDAYHPATVYSSIDHGGRYAYANQPGITHWNLARLAEALLPLIDEDVDRAIEMVTERLHTFPERYEREHDARMAAKLGLALGDPSVAELGERLLHLMEADRVDWTSLFRSLSAAAGGNRATTRELFVDLAGIDSWLDDWTARIDPGAVSGMDRSNPAFIPRNHLVEAALAAATEGDLSPFTELRSVLAAPFDDQDDRERFRGPAPVDFGRYRTFCGT